MSFLADPLFDGLPILSWAFIALGAVFAFIAEQPQQAAARARAMNVSLASLAIALLVLVRVSSVGAWTLNMGSIFTLPLSLHIDMLSAVMLVLINFIGAICTRFSLSYLDGSPLQGVFLARLLLTITTVSVLVSAGSLLTFWLAWVAVSLALRQLLLFFPDRPRARAAAVKHLWISRLGAFSLGLGFLALAFVTGTTDLNAILSIASGGDLAASATLTAAMLLIAVAAMLQSAQLPAHSWLTEVMETPTPVSALLHAGIVNAGGFLILRFADVMLLAPDAMLLLAVIGGLTALTATLIMLFQVSIKVTLAWSTIAQMGFMILQCGLGAFHAAALHIVAHSCYKAHAFLSSGSVIDTDRVMNFAGQNPALHPVRRTAMLLGVVAVYVGVLAQMGIAVLAPQALLGLVIVIGLAQFVMDETVQKPDAVLMLRLTATAAMGAVSYGALHSAAAAILSPVLPKGASAPASLILFLMLAFISLAALRGWMTHPSFRQYFAAWRIHLANGLYLSALTDRVTGRFRMAVKG